jgi:hypothetical protein
MSLRYASMISFFEYFASRMSAMKASIIFRRSVRSFVR